VGVSLPTFFADSLPTVSPFSWKIPQPWGGLGWPVSSPAMKRFDPSGKKQICALMSSPFGSSSWLRITFCFVNGGSAVYALRLFPSPLRTMTPFDDVCAGRVVPPGAAQAATSATAAAAPTSIGRSRRRCVITSSPSV
jgi:hypothetical protein